MLVLISHKLMMQCPAQGQHVPNKYVIMPCTICCTTLHCNTLSHAAAHKGKEEWQGCQAAAHSANKEWQTGSLVSDVQSTY